MSSDFKEGEEGAENYFEHFLEKDPLGIIREEEVQKIVPNTYLHSGMYDFEAGPANKREIAKARFTYLWEKGEDGKWKILHHHSFVKPKQ